MKLPFAENETGMAIRYTHLNCDIDDRQSDSPSIAAKESQTDGNPHRRAMSNEQIRTRRTTKTCIALTKQWKKRLARGLNKKKQNTVRLPKKVAHTTKLQQAQQEAHSATVSAANESATTSTERSDQRYKEMLPEQPWTHKTTAKCAALL